MSMGSCRDVGGKRAEVLLTFSREELLYDIKNCAFVEGDIMVTDNEHTKHQVFDVGECGNIDRVMRVLNLAYRECVEMLYPFTKCEVEGDSSLSNLLRVPERYVVGLSLPEGFSASTVELFRDLIHEYFVCRVLADWLSITKPESRANWEEKLEGIKRKIKTAIGSRRGPVYRRLQPF